MNSKMFNPIKNKIAVSIALLFFVLLGAGTMMAMKAPTEKKAAKFATSWFTYDGSGSITDPLNYVQVSGTPDCPGTTSMCSIQATVGSNSKPVITSALQTEINNAVNNHSPSSNVLLQDQ
ncbi:hypothetical protein ABDD95_19470 [Mucilaginibacter sp. PAMB04274]|uniref:hypothetical protein n=1 Tax=Mucilaginibacter sp. PAMB04274 TaxID=3138568 RepID=UPI0031F649BD